jgi:hypothetical protein
MTEGNATLGTAKDSLGLNGKVWKRSSSFSAGNKEHPRMQWNKREVVGLEE